MVRYWISIVLAACGLALVLLLVPRLQYQTLQLPFQPLWAKAQRLVAERARIQDSYRRGIVCRGMTTAQVEQLWGQPDLIKHLEERTRWEWPVHFSPRTARKWDRYAEFINGRVEISTDLRQAAILGADGRQYVPLTNRGRLAVPSYYRPKP
jgi:hypothetical protein